MKRVLAATEHVYDHYVHNLNICFSLLFLVLYVCALQKARKAFYCEFLGTFLLAFFQALFLLLLLRFYVNVSFSSIVFLRKYDFNLNKVPMIRNKNDSMYSVIQTYSCLLFYIRLAVLHLWEFLMSLGEKKKGIKGILSIKHLKAKQLIHNLVVYFTQFPENIQLTLIRFFISLSVLFNWQTLICVHHFIITRPGLI